MSRADVPAEVDMLPLARTAPAQASRVLGEERTEDPAVPRAEQLGGHLNRAGGRKCSQRFENLGEAVDAELPCFRRGMSARTEERRLAVVAESSKWCTKGGGHRTGQ